MLVQADAEHLGGDLAEDGVRPGAQVGGPDEEVERPVVVHLDGGRPHVDQGDARALHVERHAHPAPDGPGVAGPGALVGPAEGLHARRQALGHGAGLDRHGHALAPLAQLGEDRRGLPGADVVAAPQFDGVEAEALGHLVEGGLQREGGLGAAVAAVGPADGEVGVHRAPGEAQVGRLVVEGQGLGPGVGEHGEGVGAVGAGVLGGVHLDGVEDAVGPGPHLHPDAEGVPGAGRDELLGAGVLPAGGAAGAHGDQGADVFDQDLLLDPEAAADAGLDHPDAVDGQVQDPGDDAPQVEGDLGAGVQDQAPVVVEVGLADVGLQGGVLGVLGLAGGLHHHGAVGEGGRGVAHGDVHRRRQVVSGVPDALGVGLVVDDRRSRGQGGVQGEDRRQDLVVDGDEARGPPPPGGATRRPPPPPGRPRSAPWGRTCGRRRGWARGIPGRRW